MTEEEKKALERINNVLFDNDKSSLYIEIFKDDTRILLNLIQKQDTEINKLNNVIDKLVNFISLPEKLQKEVYCEYVTSNEDCCWKTDKECKDCIKEYFMKEDSIGK